tara:strand:+ start:4789 stop:6903 length:2115 start_codon:yes stop_codon:yes gene_type:complete
METLLLGAIITTGYLIDKKNVKGGKKPIKGGSKKLKKKKLQHKNIINYRKTGGNVETVKPNNDNNNLYMSELTGENINFKHNNMVHFYGTRPKQSMDFDNNEKLDIFTGAMELKQPKKEVGPLFEKEKQNIHGGQNYSTEYQSRINKSRNIKAELPFEQIKVGPGLGLDYESGPTGGFHQINTREYTLPKSVDELRAKNNPRVSYKGRIIDGKKGQKRTSSVTFTKDKKAVMFENRPMEATTGPATGNKYRSKVILQDTNRRVSKELKGAPKYMIGKGEQKPDHRNSDKVTYRLDSNRNLNIGKKYDFDKKAFNCSITKREEQTVKPFSLKMYMSNLLQGFISSKRYDDEAKTTIRQTTNKNDYMLNYNGKKKITKYNEDELRRTIKETLLDNSKNLANLKGNSKHQKYIDQEVKRTIRETLKNNDFNLNLKTYNKLPRRCKDKLKTTMKQIILTEQRLGNVNALSNKKGQLINNEQLKKTIKETLLKEADLLNLAGTLKEIKRYDDIAKITHKETYANNYTVGGALNNRDGGYDVANVSMVDTNRQETCNNEYSGIANREDATGYQTNDFMPRETIKETMVDNDYFGQGGGDVKPTSYEDMYNATINELKEKTLVGRRPTQEGAKVAQGGDDINMELKENLLKEEQRELSKTQIVNIVSDHNSSESTSNKSNAINDIIKYNTKVDNDLIMDQLKENPYHVSII